MDDVALPERGILLKERICSEGSKFFLLRVDPFNNICGLFDSMDDVAIPEWGLLLKEKICS